MVGSDIVAIPVHANEKRYSMFSMSEPLKILIFCGTTAMPFLNSYRSISSMRVESHKISPPFNGYFLCSIFAKVLFPVPLMPQSEVICPLGIESVKSSNSTLPFGQTNWACLTWSASCSLKERLPVFFSFSASNKSNSRWMAIEAPCNAILASTILFSVRPKTHGSLNFYTRREHRDTGNTRTFECWSVW